MRRPNGTGTVYKIKNRPLRKPYRAMVIIDWQDDGRPIRKTIGYFATSREGYAAIDHFISNPLTAKDLENEKITFAQCWEWGKQDKLRRGTLEKTIRMYDSLLNRLRPILNQPIKHLKYHQLQAVIDANKEASYSTIYCLKAIMLAAYSAAIKQEICDKNIVQMLVLPPNTQSEIHQPLTMEDLATLWQNVNNPEVANLVKAALIYTYTGMRPIELYRIKLEDVHLADRYMIGGVKTKAGRNRIIPIAECIYPFIAELYQISKFSRSETLIPPKRYIPKNPATIPQKLSKILGIEKHLPHDFRHTFVTMAKNNGMDAFILKKIVGHATNKDITDVYTHKETSQLVEAVNKLPHSFLCNSGAVVVQ